jgi:prepilin-type processing-associated H-X9-DG protein
MREGVWDAANTPFLSWKWGGSCPTWSGLKRDGEDRGGRKFTSNHPGVVQFSFADGSVRALRKGSSWIDWPNWDLSNLWPNQFPPGWQVFQELAGMRDGGAPGSSSILSF